MVVIAVLIVYGNLLDQKPLITIGRRILHIVRLSAIQSTAEKQERRENIRTKLSTLHSFSFLHKGAPPLEGWYSH